MTDRIALVERLTAAFGTEIDRLDPVASIPWPWLPTVGAMVEHLGIVHRWVTEILRTSGPVAEDSVGGAPADGVRAWYDEGRAALLTTLRTTAADSTCWIIGGRVGTAEFWRRRMVFENVKHLIDLRAAGGGTWSVAPELTTADYADGVDELFEAFLWRSRPNLAPLPGAILLEATDLPRSWRITPDWTVTGESTGDEAARVRAPAGALALTVWERADPLTAPGFELTGDPAVVAAFRDAPIHPW